MAADSPGGIYQGANFLRRRVLLAAMLGVGDLLLWTCRLKLSHKGVEMGKFGSAVQKKLAFFLDRLARARLSCS